MIVSESDILLAALDRRLAVDGVSPVDRPQAVAGAAAGPGAAASRSDASQGTVAADGDLDLATRLPLGRVVQARVLEIPREGHVVAEAESLRIDLAWPARNGVTPRVGRDLSLRVLAHRPMLLFESVAEAADASVEAAEVPRWSSDAIRLQSSIGPASSTSRGNGPTRFDIPIIDIEFETLGSDDRVVEPRASSSRTVVERTARGASPPSITDARAPIALDDIVVARSTAVVDGVATPLIPRSRDDGAAPPAAFVPLVLLGPAWPDRPMELVVRRERADESFDNPALDHWCGEVLIDLPRLGRVAGHLAVSMQGLRIRLEGDDDGTVDSMNAAAVELTRAFADAELRVLSLSVGRPTPDTRRG